MLIFLLTVLLMDKEQIVSGTVTEALPNTMFRVKLEGKEEEMLAYLSGRMKRFRIKVLIGDKVEIVTDPYGNKGRIVKRF